MGSLPMVNFPFVRRDQNSLSRNGVLNLHNNKVEAMSRILPPLLA
jgi:hypothetical protein